MRLLIGVIRRAHHGSDGRMPEPEVFGFPLEQAESRRLDVALDRQVMRGRLQVLPDGQHVHAVRPQVAHHLQDFIVGFAQPDHQAGLGWQLGVQPLEVFQEAKGMQIVASRARLAVQARYGFQVVVQDVGRRRGQDFQRDVQAAPEVGDQDLEPRARRSLAYLRDAVDEMPRAGILEVVAVHAGDDDIGQIEPGYRLGQVARLLGVGGERPAVRHVAERAAPGADVAEDHEGRRALAEALGDVRTRSFLAHRVQAVRPQDVLDLVEARVGACRAHPYPRRLGQRRARHDSYRLARAFFLYARFTHSRASR